MKLNIIFSKTESLSIVHNLYHEHIKRDELEIECNQGKYEIQLYASYAWPSTTI